jgi:Tol biopolymer transport system component
LTFGFGFGATTEASPGWRFSSDSVAFMATATGTAAIYAARASGGGVPAEFAAPATSDSAFVEPSWSPDGKFVAFTAAGNGGASRIAIKRLADGVTTFVTPPELSAGQPVVIADGRIVFAIFEAGNQSRLAWVDPALPSVVNPIQTTGVRPQNPAIIWP